MARTLSGIAAQMAAVGIIVPDVNVLAVTGRYVRFTPKGSKKKKSGWAIIFENRDRNGNIYYAGRFGEGGSEAYLIGPDRDENEEDKRVFQAVDPGLQKRIEVSREELAERAAGKARYLWEKATQDEFLVGSNAYLAKKGCKAYGLRSSEDGKTLYIPVTKRGRIVSLQTIRETSDGFEKRFMQYADMKGGYHIIGEITAETECAVVCEGYATGATIHQATGLPVVVCFFCHNLIPVVEALRSAYPKVRIINAADDDRHIKQRARKYFQETFGVKVTLQPAPKGEPKFERLESKTAGVMSVAVHEHYDAGRVYSIRSKFEFTAEDGQPRSVTRNFENAGRKAAHELEQYQVETVFPFFKDKKSLGTDFNDLCDEEGLAVVRELIMRVVERRDGAAGINWLFDRFMLIYGQDVVWDAAKGRLLKVSAGKTQWPKAFQEWLESPRRRMIDPEQLVFAPDGNLRPGEVNTFGGLPVVADASKPCGRIVEHLRFLCGSEEVFQWVSKWLAYPLQNPGAKMHTALVLHGVREGTGKNLFFSVLNRIYGPDYSTVINQKVLDSEFNGYLSRKLFIVADEVLSQQEKRRQKGLIKDMITGAQHAINEKNMPMRMEPNLCNFVFLSNELQPLALDPHDRRFMVIKVEKSQSPEYYEALAREIEDGGDAGFLAWLMKVDLEGFHPATRPLETDAHKDLVELGMPASERFLNAWFEGDTAFPLQPCALQHLFEAFQLWRSLTGDQSRENQLQFSHRLNRREVQKRRMRVLLWPTWYDPVEISGMPPEYEKSQQMVYVPGEFPEESLLDLVRDFQGRVIHERKNIRRM